MVVFWILMILLLPLFSYYYVRMKSTLKYWKERDVAHVEPLPFFGNALTQIMKRDSFFGFLNEIYNSFPGETVVGFYQLTTPWLLIRDPGLIKNILVKDFHCFADRSERIYHKTLTDLTLFNLNGNQWRSIRSKVSSTLTNKKLKCLFGKLLFCTENLVVNLGSRTGEDEDLKPTLTSYAIDVILSVIFGLEIKENNLREEFDKNTKTLLKSTPFKYFNIFSTFPELRRILGIDINGNEQEIYFKNILLNNFENRSNSETDHYDNIDLLFKLKQNVNLEPKGKDSEKTELTNDLLAAQAFQFLSKGFEPIINTFLFTLYEAAKDETVQFKMRKEVHENIKVYSGYTYESVDSMNYIEQCIKETLRLHPVIPFLTRVCLMDYEIDDGLVIEKGTKLIIPSAGLQTDPKYHTNPDKFDPDRFGFDPVDGREFTTLTFGGGPRNCIGMNFSLILLKLTIARILENHNVKLSARTNVPIGLSKRSYLLEPEGLRFVVIPLRKAENETASKTGA